MPQVCRYLLFLLQNVHVQFLFKIFQNFHFVRKVNNSTNAFRWIDDNRKFFVLPGILRCYLSTSIKILHNQLSLYETYTLLTLSCTANNKINSLSFDMFRYLNLFNYKLQTLFFFLLYALCGYKWDMINNRENININKIISFAL